MQQERVLQQALEDNPGLQFPSQFHFLLQEYFPSLLNGSDKAAVRAQETHENLIELKETVKQVRLEDLWARLLEGVPNDEVALDAGELEFLFSGDTKERVKKARHFINRICNLAEMEPVEVPYERTTLGEISTLRDSVRRVGQQIGGCQTELEQKFEVLTPLLHPELISAAPEAKAAEALLGNIGMNFSKGFAAPGTTV